jgi:23S rRNA (adenine2030-N6)-methyltransferase
MFSYRHAFHAGNHADVLKHSILLAILRHLVQKDAPLMVFDTHAGAGLYRLDGDFAQTSAEAAEGYLKLINSPPAEPLAPLLQDYLDLVASFNTKGSHKVYPGSPFIIQRVLADRPRDKLKLFELHPTDTKTLQSNIAQLEAGRQVTILRDDGFAGVGKFLPPPSRRGLLLCDPSYELKTDYGRVAELIGDALQRFSTGTYAVWYPIIPRPEAHDLPRRLKTLANKAGKPWLGATLTVKSSKLRQGADGEVIRPGLPASGMFVINPPHTLKAGLQQALPQLVAALQQDSNAAFTLESGG